MSPAAPSWTGVGALGDFAMPLETHDVTLVAARALEMIRDDTAVGLGSGRAAAAFVQALGARVQAGLRVRGVATSQATAELARQVGIPLVSLADVEQRD